jgi:YNFM family putative membrane transporter
VDRAHRAGINAAKASSAYLLLYYSGSTIFGTAATFIWSGFGWSGVTVLGVSLGVSSIVCAAIAAAVLRESPVTDDTGEIDTIVGA